jgi:hypothetical protein
MLVNYGASGDLKNESGVTAAAIMIRKRNSEFRDLAEHFSGRA